MTMTAESPTTAGVPAHKEGRIVAISGPVVDEFFND